MYLGMSMIAVFYVIVQRFKSPTVTKQEKKNILDHLYMFSAHQGQSVRHTFATSGWYSPLPPSLTPTVSKDQKGDQSGCNAF